MADGISGAGAVFIKRVKKVEGGHHGGAWKIAYADFVTAMMAFFLLLWLLNSVTQEQLEGISNYFAPASVAATTSGAGGVLGGQTLTEEGSEVSARAKPTVSLELPPPKTGLGGEDSSETQKPESEAEDKKEETSEATPESVTEAAIKKLEAKQFEDAQEELKKALIETPEAAKLKDSLMVDDTPEGLRIQIVDQEGLAMFASGGIEPLPRALRLLHLVKDVIDKMPQKISISGHTDATRFGSGAAYTNWELSVDRANAARRALRDFGLPVERLSYVSGKADTEPLLKDDPTNARNRRLSIVLLRGSSHEGPTVEVQEGKNGPTLIIQDAKPGATTGGKSAPSKANKAGAKPAPSGTAPGKVGNIPPPLSEQGGNIPAKEIKDPAIDRLAGPKIGK
ncbi:MAG: OmpA family protein [Rhodospirillales bacterium]|nr:OmpA family protein [Rhodospirillales bacterium]